MDSLLDKDSGPRLTAEKPYNGQRQATKTPVSETMPVFLTEGARIAKAGPGRTLQKGEKFIVATVKTLWKDVLFQAGQKAIIKDGEKLPPDFQEV